MSIDQFLLSADTTDLNYPEVRPTLDLNFARTKILDPRITFTRASGGSYVGADGLIKYAGVNEPRFDHNPETGESLGLLIEESRRNLLLQSNGFNTTWTNGNSSETAASGIAPDGTNTAWTFTDSVDASPAAHELRQGSIAGTSGASYTYSVYAKAGTLPELILAFPSAIFGASAATRFNLLNGTVAVAGPGTTNSIVSVGNGWYRLISTLTATASTTGTYILRLGNGAGGTYQGDGTGTVLIWGAQLEARFFPTSYIPTTTTSVTRAADVARISGSNFSSWYRQDEGSIYAEYAVNAKAYTAVVFGFSDGTLNNSIILRGMTSTNSSLSIGSSGRRNQWLNGFSPQTTAITKWALGVKTYDIGFVRNGYTITPNTSAIIPVVNQLRLGSDSDGSAPLNGVIRRFTYWPQRLPNSHLQTLTK